MKEKIPNYVFKKKYDCFFLFLDSEVIMNHNFTKKLLCFLKETNSDRLEIELDLPVEYKNLFSEKIIIENPSVESFSDFYESEVKVKDKFFPTYFIDYFINNQSLKWEAYVSNQYEICIFGCDSDLESLFEVVFQPYKEFKLDEKYSWITNMFQSENKKNDYLRTLENNYKFR